MTPEQQNLLERNYVQLAEAFKKLADDYQTLSIRYQNEKMYREALAATLQAIRDYNKRPKTKEDQILAAVSGSKTIELQRENGQTVGAVIRPG